MKTLTALYFFVTITLSTLLPSVIAIDAAETVADIMNNAATDNIDFTSLHVFDAALAEITSIYEGAPDSEETNEVLRRRRLHVRGGGSQSNGISLHDFLGNGQRIDMHSHVTPSWYRNLVPVTGGNPTPIWSLDNHIAFMNSESIDKAIIEFSAPGANVFQGNKLSTVALARLLNEQLAAYCAAYPNKFKFFAVVPLPYVQEAIVEAEYALKHLGAAGLFLTSNFEGTYLGDPKFKPFFQAINNLSGKKVFHIHPSIAYIRNGNRLLEANPTRYPSGNLEFYFETARMLTDLFLTQTIHNFTSITYVIPHVGGAFPAAIDRVLISSPAIYNSSLEVLRTRFFWDSAGPTYHHQVAGLLAYNIPKSQLVFGTDFPYAPIFTQPGSLGAILSSPLLTSAEKTALFSTNARNAFSGVDA